MLHSDWISDFVNYRPICNLSFLSKLLEKVVQGRLQAFLDGSDLIQLDSSFVRHNEQ